MIERYRLNYGWQHQRGWTVVTPLTLLGRVRGRRAVAAVTRWWAALPASDAPGEDGWRYDGGASFALTPEPGPRPAATLAIRSAGEDACDTIASYADLVADLVDAAEGAAPPGGDPDPTSLSWTELPVAAPTPSPEVVAALAPTGALRAVVNLGNPVLAQGDPVDPRGITVELSRLLASYLAVPLELTCVTAARESVAAVEGGAVDVAFVAIDPGRAERLAFTEPYAVIEGVYVVPDGSGLQGAADVDAPGVRVGVKEGSAYDLHLTRELAAARVVRGEGGVEVYVREGLEAGAGIRGPVLDWAAGHPGHRVLEPAFMQIRQAMAVRVDGPETGLAILRGFVRHAIESGFVVEMLARSGQDPSLAAR